MSKYNTNTCHDHGGAKRLAQLRSMLILMFDKIVAGEALPLIELPTTPHSLVFCLALFPKAFGNKDGEKGKRQINKQTDNIYAGRQMESHTDRERRTVKGEGR